MGSDVLGNIIRRTIDGFTERLADFGPHVLVMLLLLIVGAIVAGLLRIVLQPSLRWLGADRFAERTGVAQILRRGGGTGAVSSVVAVATAWMVFGGFLLLAIGALDLQFATDFVSRAFTYLPQLLFAVVILVVGFLLADFIRRSVLIAAVNAGLKWARLLAAAAQGVVTLVFVAMAMEHIGVGRQVVLTAFAILFGGVVLALALAFGLAGRDLAREALEGAVRKGPPEEPGSELRHV